MKNKNNINKCSGGRGNFSCRHPKLWKYIKSNVKAFFITGAIVFTITASATTVKILHSRQVRYKNDKSVEQAINELYEKANQIEMKKMGCDGCTKLEYLESTGTQYINTEKKYYDIGRIEMQFLITKVNGTAFGRNTSGSEVILFFGGQGQSYLNGTHLTHVSPIANHVYNVVMDITNGNAKLIIDGENVGTSTGSSRNLTDYIMLLYRYENFNGASFNLFERFYKFKCNDNEGSPMLDFIPVLDKNNRPCLFDKVSKTCFYNQGIGEFLYG